MWTLVEPVSGLSATVVPNAGDIKVVEDQVTAVTYPMNGGSPYVTDSPRRARTVTVPELVCMTTAEVEQLRLLRSLGRRMLLTDDTGEVWPVRFVGGVTVRVLDTPDRATKPIRYVTVTMVGVA